MSSNAYTATVATGPYSAAAYSASIVLVGTTNSTMAAGSSYSIADSASVIGLSCCLLCIL